jgi:hypothetical protein
MYENVNNQKYMDPMADTWEKILEYASSPIQGTLSRKLRKGVKLKVNDSTVYSDVSVFINEYFVRFIGKGENGETVNTYYDLHKISSLSTISSESET